MHRVLQPCFTGGCGPAPARRMSDAKGRNRSSHRDGGPPLTYNRKRRALLETFFIKLVRMPRTPPGIGPGLCGQILGKLERSKSQPLDTDRCNGWSYVWGFGGWWGASAVLNALDRGYPGGLCSGVLPRIPLLGTSVNSHPWVPTVLSQYARAR